MISANQDLWQKYLMNPFVVQLAAGTLPADAYARYQAQDAKYLVQYARARALAAYKLDGPPIEKEQTTRDYFAEEFGDLDALLARRGRLRDIAGISEAAALGVPATIELIAYTRYIIDKAMAGDIVDLEIVVSPCTVGYTVLGCTWMNDKNTKREGNPYYQWIVENSGPEAIAQAKRKIQLVESVFAARAGDNRRAALGAIFAQAIQFEIEFFAVALKQTIDA